MKNKRTWGLLCLSSLLFCCGEKSPQQAVSEVAKAVTEDTNAVRNRWGIAGNWNSQCQQVSPIPQFKSILEQYHFSDNSNDFNKKTLYFNDDNCSNPSFIIQESGTIEFQGDTTPSEGVLVNFNIRNVKIQVANNTAKKILESIRNCGVGTWNVGEDVDVTSQSAKLSCLGVKRTPRVTYDCIKVEDNRLYLGKDADEDKPENRPSVADRTKVFVKE